MSQRDRSYSPGLSNPHLASTLRVLVITQCAPGAHLRYPTYPEFLTSYGIRGSYVHSSLGLSLTRQLSSHSVRYRPSALLSALNSLLPTSPLQGALKGERSWQISYMHMTDTIASSGPRLSCWGCCPCFHQLAIGLADSRVAEIQSPSPSASSI